MNDGARAAEPHYAVRLDDDRSWTFGRTVNTRRLMNSRTERDDHPYDRDHLSIGC
jgi:hypothetical protein